jgi:hypothetical protein
LSFASLVLERQAFLSATVAAEMHYLGREVQKRTAKILPPSCQADVKIAGVLSVIAQQTVFDLADLLVQSELRCALSPTFADFESF